MKCHLSCLVFLAWAAGASFAQASDSRNIGWTDLLPNISMGANPFDALPFRQSNALAKLYRIEVKEAATASDFMKAQAAEIRSDLETEGLDPDWYLQERERVFQEHAQRLAAPNPEILGQHVRVPGYIVPLQFDGMVVTEFLLVPTAGACIHTPPPPANQLIHVKYPKGYPLRGLYDPVWIDGTLRAETHSELVSYSDGQRIVASSYTMRADNIFQYQ
jgi:uncharacterized protein